MLAIDADAPRMTLNEAIGYIQCLCDAKSESCPFYEIGVIHNTMCYVVEWWV